MCVGCRSSRSEWHGMCALALLLPALLCVAIPAWAGQIQTPASPLPDAPQPQLPTTNLPCSVSNSQPGAPPVCQRHSSKYWFDRFLTGPSVKPLTSNEKARLAARNVLDPFNAITILGSSAIAIGSDAHSAYGPGMTGFGKYVGVSYTQDITGEFFSTFLIPSLVHQDPHYHRMPNASIKRRIGHAIAQVAWTQGDNGQGMVNYGDLLGAAIEDEVNNLYVPGRKTNLPSSGARYGIGIATAPIDNFVSEFLPDVARHVHVQIVVLQRIINQVAKTEGSSQP